MFSSIFASIRLINVFKFILNVDLNGYCRNKRRNLAHFEIFALICKNVAAEKKKKLSVLFKQINNNLRIFVIYVRTYVIDDYLKVYMYIFKL